MLKYASFLKNFLAIFLSSDYQRIKNQTVFCCCGGGRSLAQGSGKKITMTQITYLFITVPTLRFGQGFNCYIPKNWKIDKLISGV